ncbi:MAG: bile acid:sodium symporter family protein [Pirellulales bacterium]|nr:bile acid:sodium symporter family protein [Pirellulales bacterium]
MPCISATLFMAAVLTGVGAVGLSLARCGAYGGIAAVLSGTLCALSAATSRRFQSLAFTLWVLAFGVSAWCYPWLYTWSLRGWEPKQAILPLVQVIMFGMGVTLTFDDFGRVARMPRAVLIGVVCQYTIMPLAGWTFARTFGLPSEVAAGLILIGSCPGGVASNVIAYLARANVALSVTMTACSTAISPLATPRLVQALAGQYVPIDVGEMTAGIFGMILLPVLLGLLGRRYTPRLVQKVTGVLPAAAMFSICVIIAITIALARADLAAVGLSLFGAAVCHNAAGYALGYGAARGLGLDRRDSRTVALEVGIQNGGMATALALNVWNSPAAALGSAVFGPWSALSSSLLASWWRRSGREEKRSRRG